MDKPLDNFRASTARATPKDFFLWAGAMIAFYWSVLAFIFLIFNYIDYSFPSALTYLAANPYDSGIGFEMASIVVLFPVYCILMWLIRRDSKRDPSRREIWVRRWALILTLFLAGVAMVGDLVSLLNTFFSGNELTLGFLLKTLLLLLVAAGVFMHFIADLWGYWDQHVVYKRLACSAAGLIMALAVLTGFIIFGTPWQAQQYRLDAERVSDLQNIQEEIVMYWQDKQTLPSQLSDLNDPIQNYSVPVDPGTSQSYEYRATGTTSFELCADFGASSMGEAMITVPEPASLGGGTPVSDNWSHGAARTCFERTIDPQKYPPITPTSSTGRD
jgi:Domain of unknown function (DUF5671)